MRSWLKEPLLHFLVLAAAVFSLHRWASPPTTTKEIRITPAALDALRLDHERRAGAPPNAAEEAAIVQRFIDQEVLYREAVAMGLDRGDIIVRRRMIQKMEFILENGDPVPEPTEAQLQEYLDRRGDRYELPERVSFVHVFTSFERHPADAEAVARSLREQLEAGAPSEHLGEAFLRGRRLRLQTLRELTGIFGPSFAAAVRSLPVGAWSAPVASTHGLHVVRVEEREAVRRPALAEIRESVLTDWQEEQRAEINRRQMERLRGTYRVLVERAAPSGSVAEAAER